MKIGNIIRKYRKTLGMTQEEVANRLGVTTPAVNKWENHASLPDITLLAPIARLLGITTDKLLSFKEELTTEEIDNITLQLHKDLKDKDYNTVFLWAKSKIEEYPNCDALILEVAAVLEMWPVFLGKDIPNKENYQDIILKWYEQCLDSEDEKIRDLAAQSLFNYYFRKTDYEMALNYVKYFCGKNSKRKFMEAMVYSKNGKKNEAYKAYEELLLSKYNTLSYTLVHLCMLYKEDNNHAMANKLVNISLAISKYFDMNAPYYLDLEIAVWEKDVSRTEKAIRNVLDSFGAETKSMKSPLYQHMNFNDLGDDIKSDLGIDPESSKKRFIEGCKDKKFDYMRESKLWKELILSDND